MINLNLEDKNQVRNYLIYKLSNNRLFKGNKFYTNLIKLYGVYPEIIIDIIDKLPELTYYKDYFRILYLSKNEELNQHIYQILLDQIKRDIENYNKNEPISTLAKWLPRKGREYDRKLNFVNKFGEMLFGKINRIQIFRKYQKTVANLTKVINPIEINLCSNQLSQVDLNKVTTKNYYTYKQKFMKHSELSEQLNEVKNLEINTMNYHQFILKVLWLSNLNDYKKKFYDHEIKIIEDIWENNFFKYTENLSYDVNNKYLILDLNTNMFNNMKNDIIKISLLFLRVNDYVVINKKNPIIIKRKSLFESLEEIIKNIGLSLILNMDNINNKVKNEKLTQKQYVVITERPYDNIKYAVPFDYIVYNNKLFVKKKENYYEGNFLINKYENKKKKILDNIFKNFITENKFENIKKIMYVMLYILIMMLLLFNINKFI